MRSIPGPIEESMVDWVHSGHELSTPSGSTQVKLSSDGTPSENGSLEHGKTSADIGPLDLETAIPASLGKHRVAILYTSNIF